MSRALALIDGDSFYGPCERVFDPKPKAVPVIVLSNNDGCAIARTAEAEALGIAMGDPWFDIRDRCRRDGIRASSSNDALYASMSARANAVCRRFSPRVEARSIDEAFPTCPTSRRRRAPLRRATAGVGRGERGQTGLGDGTPRGCAGGWRRASAGADIRRSGASAPARCKVMLQMLRREPVISELSPATHASIGCNLLKSHGLWGVSRMLARRLHLIFPD